VRFTKASIEALELPPGRTELIVWDEDLPGFGCRVHATRKTWRIQYRIGNQQHSMSLGDVRRLDPDSARKAARRLLAQAKLGRDPVAEKRSSPLRDLEQRTAAKALKFLKRGIEPACYLYRHFHPGGDLLYVGISLEALRRQDRHLKSADWRNLIHRIVIEPFGTREEALDAEQFATRTEFPRFNTARNRRRRPDQKLARLGRKKV
jgi:hypothetical protein